MRPGSKLELARADARDYRDYRDYCDRVALLRAKQYRSGLGSIPAYNISSVSCSAPSNGYPRPTRARRADVTR